MGFGFVVLRGPKTRKTFARQQHVRIDDPLIVALMRAACAGRASSDFFWPWAGSAATRARAFRACWDALTSALGMPSVLPSGIRAGAITWYYDCGMALADIQWIGRWTQLRTLASYIQEVAAVRVLGSLSPPERARLVAAADDAVALAHRWLARVC